MSEKKEVRVTKTQRFEDIKALLCGEEVKYGTDVTIACEFIEHEIGLLSKKNNSDNKKQTATQKENEKYKVIMLNILANKPDGMTCTEMLKEIPEMVEAGYGNQKVSALFRQLKAVDKVVSEEIKGKTYFRLA